METTFLGASGPMRQTLREGILRMSLDFNVIYCFLSVLTIPSLSKLGYRLAQ